MPELPEVETVVRALRPSLVGRTIRDFSTDWPNQIVTPSVEELRLRIRDRRVLGIDRRAKYIVVRLDAGEMLIVHLKMTGHLSIVASGVPRDKWTHVWFALDGNDELRFRDMRKFGRIYLTTRPADILGKLGPEPLDAAFTPAVLADRLSATRRAIKAALLDQHLIAGVGNIYADEALFAANIHPLTPANALSDDQTELLHRAIRHVLRLGIEREGASISNYVKPDGAKGDMQNAVNVFRRTAAPCYACGTPIERIRVTQRSTHFCPRCQPLP